MEDRFRRCHTQQHRFNGQQSTRLQWVALQCHRQGKDKFSDQDPTGNKGTEKVEGQWIEE